jgi:hypothetical protein
VLVPHSTGGVKTRLGSVDEEFYSPTKTQSLRNKIDAFVQLPMETITKALRNKDGEDGDRGRSSRPKGYRGKIHMRGVFIVVKMLETQVGQLAGHPMGNKGQSQGPEKEKATQTHSGNMENHTKETMKITTGV